MRNGRAREVPVWVVAISAAFALGLLALVVSSFLRPTPETHAPSAPGSVEVGGGTADGLYTVDARDPDRWVFFDFSRRSVVADPGPLEWDLAFRRFHIVVNGGTGYAGEAGARRLEDGPTERLELPAEGYAETEGSLDAEAYHPALAGWYEYGFFTHLLTPRAVTYAVRTADGRYAALRFVGYYCPGAVPGCVTFRYAYRGDGGRALVLPGDAASSEPGPASLPSLTPPRLAGDVRPLALAAPRPGSSPRPPIR